MKRKIGKIILYIALYGIVSFATNYICSMAGLRFVQLVFVPIADKLPYAILFILVLLSYVLSDLFIPISFVYLVMRYTVPRLYALTNGNSAIGSFLIHVFPMEFLRYLVCLSSLGHIRQTGLFSSLPTFMFENTYIRWSGRHNQIRNYLDYVSEDFFAYSLCYLVYAVVYVTFVVLIYKKHWKVGKEESEELVVYDNKHNLY